MLEKSAPLVQKPALSDADAAEMRMVAGNWLDYYYRPLIFPEEYFENYKQSVKHKLLSKELPKLYKDFKEIFSNSITNQNSYIVYKELLEKPTKENADLFFNETWHFIDYALNVNTDLIRLKLAGIPFAGKMMQIMQNASSKETKANMLKIQNFLHDLFLDTYSDWIFDLRGETNV